MFDLHMLSGTVFKDQFLSKEKTAGLSQNHQHQFQVYVYLRDPYKIPPWYDIILQLFQGYWMWFVFPNHPNNTPYSITSSEASDSDPSLRSEYEPVCALSSALLVPQLVAALQLILTKDTYQAWWTCWGCEKWWPSMFWVILQIYRIWKNVVCDNFSTIMNILNHTDNIHPYIKQPKDPKWSTEYRFWKSASESLQNVRTSRHGNACGPYAMPGTHFHQSKAIFGPQTDDGSNREARFVNFKWIV